MKAWLALALCSLVVIPLAGCGGSDEKTQTVDTDAIKQQGRDEQRLKQLEAEVQRQRRQQDRSNSGSNSGGNNGGSSNGNGGASSGGGSANRSCGGGLTVNGVTTCGFADIVRSAYESSDSGTVDAYSPATGKTYTMNCSSGSPHVCTGGNGARVEFP